MKSESPRRQLLTAGLIFAILVALAAGAATMYVAWEHNLQGEFHEVAADGSTTVHWAGLLLIAGAWSTGVFGVLLLAGLAWRRPARSCAGCPDQGKLTARP